MSIPGHAPEPELRRMAFRVALFTKRGMDDAGADKLADRLMVRDAERDDRRLCMECAHLKVNVDFDADPPMSWRSCSKRGPFMEQQLQRCPQFQWERPA